MNAKVALRQVGGAVLARVGARGFVASEDAVWFFVLRGRSRKILIRLNANDLYDVEVWRLRKGEATREWRVENVYADSLGETVEALAMGRFVNDGEIASAMVARRWGIVR